MSTTNATTTDVVADTTEPLDLGDEGIASDATIARYLNVHVKSLPRWDRKPELGFPPPIYINNRKFRSWAAVKEFIRRAAVAHARLPAIKLGGKA